MKDKEKQIFENIKVRSTKKSKEILKALKQDKSDFEDVKPNIDNSKEREVIKQVFDKEKQIEEMAKDIKDACFKTNVCYYENEIRDCDKCRAKWLFKLGYRKLPEDSVVLSREEYNNLKLEIQKAHNKGVRIGFDLTKFKQNSIEKTRKETAENIIHDLDMKISNYAMVLDLPELPEKIRLIPTEVMEHFSKTLKEQFGVEIKE